MAITETKYDNDSEHIDNVPAAEEVRMPEYGPEEERKAVRKLDIWLIPMLGLINLCSFIDRGNIGNARTAGLGASWGITSDQYSWLIMIYFIAYICFHWTILLWKVVDPPLFVMCVSILWGMISMLQATMTSFGGLLACRFFIGVAEACFAPGVSFYLSFFYNRREMGLRYGLFISSAALASCFASAMAYGILHAHSSLQGWQLLFVVEGAPTIVLAVVAKFVLPKSPKSVPFLNERETEIVSTRAIKGRGAEREGKLNFKQVFSAFYDYKNYLAAVIIFCVNASYNSLPAYLPTIIEDIGIGNSLTSQGLTAPPYFVAFLVCIVASLLSDKLQNRSIFLSILCTIGGLGYLLLSVFSSTSVRYFSTYLVCCGTFPAVPITFTWVTDNQGSASKRGAGLVVFGIIGQCGSIFGARLFPKSQAPLFTKSMAICAGILFFGAIVSQLLSICLRLQNRARDRKFGKARKDEVPQDIFDHGDQHPMYRYVV